MKKRETVVFLPGFTIGTVKSFYLWLSNLQKCLNQEWLRVFICTWDEPENNEWTSCLQEDLTKKRGIIPYVLQIPYDHKDVVDFYKDFYRELDIPFNGTVPLTTFKRTIPFFLYHRGVNWIKSYLPNVYDIDVIKVRTALHFYHEHLSTNATNFYEKLHNAWQHQFSPIDLVHIKTPYDILYTPKVSRSLIDEIVYATSLVTLSKIFEPKYEIFVKKLSLFFKKFIEAHEDVYNVFDVHSFDILHSMPNTTPLEGGSVFHHMVTESRDKIMYTSDPYIMSNIGIAPFLVGTANFGIEGYKVVKKSDWVLDRQYPIDQPDWITNRVPVEELKK